MDEPGKLAPELGATLPANPGKPADLVTADTVMAEGTMAASRDALTGVRIAADLPLVDAAHYEMLSEHARGGLGRIVRARDRRTGRMVAIKEMLGDDDAAARRFAQEAMITANLMHPAIVPVYELGRWASGAPFYAMKLVAGTSFEHAVRDAKHAGLADRIARLPVIVSVAEALAYAHARRVIHRDLKPANVLVGEYGETVVIDWGLAKIVDAPEPRDAAAPTSAEPILTSGEQTVAGSIMGTPAYMPPEQALGDPVDERADVYAIGAMLYFVIAGVAPFADRKARDLTALLALVATDAPTPLAQLQPTAPADLVAIATKAMAHDRAARYRSARELADDLRRFTTGQLVSAHRYDLRALVGRWLRKHRAAVTVAVVLVALLIGGGVLSVRRILAEKAEAVRETAVAVEQQRVANANLATALYQKGRVAEGAQEWTRAAMYYAASRVRLDSPETRWAASFAEARAIVPQARHDGHTARVNAVAVAPDGERVATVDDVGELRVWSPRDGALIAHRKLSDRALHAVAFARDGQELAVGGDEGTIWRLAPDLATRGQLRGHVGRVWSIAYAPDDALLASAGDDHSVRLWSLPDGAPRILPGKHTQRVYDVEFSPDGKQLVSGSDDRTAWLWDVATGRGHKVGEHLAGGVRYARFLPSGDQIVTAGWDAEVRVWHAVRDPDAEMEPPLESWLDIGQADGAAVSPDGGMIVIAGFAGIHAWEISTQENITTIHPRDAVDALAFSRDGHWLVTGGDGPPRVWDARALHRLAVGGHRASVSALHFSPSGKRLLSAANRDHTIRVWDATTGSELARITTPGTCGDGALMLGEDQVVSTCDDKTIRRWDLTGREIGTVPTDVWLRTTSLSSDGKTFAAGHMNGKLALYDVATWTLITEITAHQHQIYGAHLMPDGRVVTASLDSHVKVWRGRDLALDLDVDMTDHDGLLGGDMSPDGTQIVATSEDNWLTVWDVAQHTWFGGGRGARMIEPGVAHFAFAPDSAHIYVAGSDPIVRIYDTRTWAPPGPADAIDAHEGHCTAVGVSRDGATLALGFDDGAIVLWDVASRRIRTRVGGSTRDHGSCDDLAAAGWVDDAQRLIVGAACAQAPEVYANHIAATTQQYLDGIDVHWAWEREPPTSGSAQP